MRCKLVNIKNTWWSDMTNHKSWNYNFWNIQYVMQCGLYNLKTSTCIGSMSQRTQDYVSTILWFCGHFLWSQWHVQHITCSCTPSDLHTFPITQFSSLPRQYPPFTWLWNEYTPAPRSRMIKMAWGEREGGRGNSLNADLSTSAHTLNNLLQQYLIGYKAHDCIINVQPITCR